MCFREGGGSAEYGQRPYFYIFIFLDPSLTIKVMNFFRKVMNFFRTVWAMNSMKYTAL